MSTNGEFVASSLFICLEWFLFGVYSGIFAIYLQCSSKGSRPAIIVFYVLCLLYILSIGTVIGDLLTITLEARINTLPHQLQINSQLMIYHLSVVSTITNGCCDFITQCIMIYRCWIVWGKNIYVVIIPSFLAILGLASCLSTQGALTYVQDQYILAPWGTTMNRTGLAVSMAVNTMATGLIVFKILVVFLEVKAIPVERISNLGSLNSTIRGSKLRHVIFIIIESGMALFAIQLLRLVLEILPEAVLSESTSISIAVKIVIGVHEMVNGIAPTIILVRVSAKLSFDDEESFKEAAGSLRFINNPPSSIPHLDRSEDT